MTLAQLYASVGGNLDEVAQRIPGKLILKFVKMYAADGSFQELTTSLAAQDWHTAFRAAHTLKGVSQNLGFTDLFNASYALTEALRGDKALTDQALYTAVQVQHQRVMDALAQLDEG